MIAEAIKTCKTCKWHGTNKNPKICTNTKINDTGIFFNEKDQDMISYSFYEGGWFESGDNFGCIHHGAK